RSGVLADETLEPELARVLEHLPRASFQVRAESYGSTVLERFPQARLALGQRQPAQVLARQKRRVEHEIRDVGVAPGVERVLQRLEVRAAVASGHDDLA